jgi:hypothetical protein
MNDKSITPSETKRAPRVGSSALLGVKVENPISTHFPKVKPYQLSQGYIEMIPTPATPQRPSSVSAKDRKTRSRSASRKKRKRISNPQSAQRGPLTWQEVLLAHQDEARRRAFLVP